MTTKATKDAIFLLASPNIELLPGHGFEFSLLNGLCVEHFREHAIFENAFAPVNEQAVAAWEQRQRDGKTGVTLSTNINIEESFRPCDAEQTDRTSYDIKQGLKPGVMQLAGLTIDTTHLHNTHSFVVLAHGKR